MAKPKATDRQKLRAYKLWAELKFGPTAIHEMLETEFKAKGPRKPVSIDTVKKWIADFKKLDIDFDKPFHWHQMDEYGIPWEASNVITQIWKEFILTMPSIDEAVGKKPSPPTFRQVRWWWRVYQAAWRKSTNEKRKITLIDLVLWADRFAAEEVSHEVLGYEPEFDGLYAYLAFRPWSSDEAAGEYLQAIRDKKVPPPRNFSQDPELVDQLIDFGDEELAALVNLHPYGMARDPTLTPTQDAGQRVAFELVKLAPEEQWWWAREQEKKLWRLQGLSEDEIKRRLHKFERSEFLANDPDGDGYVILKPMEQDLDSEVEE